MSKKTNRDDIGECRVENDDILNQPDKENSAPISLRATNGRHHPSILKSQNKQSTLILNLPALRGTLKSAQSDQKNDENPFGARHQPLLPVQSTTTPANTSSLSREDASPLVHQSLKSQSKHITTQFTPVVPFNGLDGSIGGRGGTQYISNNSSSEKHPLRQNLFVSNNSSPFTTSQMVSFSSVPSSSQKKNLYGILRPGESVDQLFHLDCIAKAGTNNTQRYWELCRSIVDVTFFRSNAQSNQDDTREIHLLKQIIEMASQFVSNASTCTKEGSTHQLMCLYRRATSRLSSFVMSANNSDDICDIWLLYCKDLVEYSFLKEARICLQHVQNLKIGNQRALLYIILSRLEEKCRNFIGAEEYIWKGIRNNAMPLQELRDALKILRNNNTPIAAEVQSNTDREVNDVQSPSQSRDQSSNRSPKRKPKQEISPRPTKKRKGKSDEVLNDRNNGKDQGTRPQLGDSNYPDHNNRVNDSFRSENSNMSLSMSLDDLENIDTDKMIEENKSFQGNISMFEESVARPLMRFQLNEALESNSHMTTQHEQQRYKQFPEFGLNEVSIKETASSQPKEIKYSLNTSVDGSQLPRMVFPNAHFDKKSKNVLSTMKSGSPSLTNNFSSTKKKPPLQYSKLSQRMAKLPTLGLPQRVSKNEPLDVESEFENVRTDKKKEVSAALDVECIDRKETEAHAKNSEKYKRKPKITKTDLSYMLQWNPERRTSPNTKTTLTDTGTSNDVKTNESVILERIEESDSSGGNVSGGAEREKHLKQCAEQPLVKSNLSDSKMVNTLKQSPSIQQSKPLEVGKTISSTSDTLDAQIYGKRINKDFLPLVSESNMIKVNDVQYAKLGVIGKGGSCKVYRALSSKDYSTVAIKKVKLDGMDKKAIAGYSNEIKLLKRLRDNPSIIQLYDSEVDLTRKAIFLVMESGEVDLNNVLQKQVMQNESDNINPHGRRFNLNFIRLTWQQMLTAVHSMHEVRIIHGDLKPANFLFVRGALKLIDFGIAKAIQNDDTTNIYRETQIGTLNYMSPESLLSESHPSSSGGKSMKCGRPSDIWSLGCILYQMIYGKTPYSDLHPFEKMMAISNPAYQVKYPELAQDEMDPNAIDAIQKCLRWKASDRPPIVGKDGLLNEHPFLNLHHGRTNVSNSNRTCTSIDPSTNVI